MICLKTTTSQYFAIHSLSLPDAHSNRIGTSHSSLSRSLSLSLGLSRSLSSTPALSLAPPLSLEQKDLMPQQLVKTVQLTVTEVRCEFNESLVFCLLVQGLWFRRCSVLYSMILWCSKRINYTHHIHIVCHNHLQVPPNITEGWTNTHTHTHTHTHTKHTQDEFIAYNAFPIKDALKKHAWFFQVHLFVYT